MKTTLNIKNFRVFDENGVTFELNPITILTGSNSSGKSSVVKAVFMLNSFLAQIKKAIEKGDPIEIDKYKLDFTTYPNNLLGRFDKVVHDGSEAKTVTIEYTTYSLMLSKDVTVELVFSADENDVLNNAYLQSITMSTDEGVFYYSGKNRASYCNLNIIKEDYITFLLVEYAVHKYSDIDWEHAFGYGLEEEEYKAKIKDIIDYLRTLDNKRRSDIFRFVRHTIRQKSIIDELKADANSLVELQGKKSIFAIPIINELSKLPKNEVGTFIETKFLENAGEDLIFASHKIINAFMESGFDTFDDFFADEQTKKFEKMYCTRKPSAPSDLLTIGCHLLKAYNLEFEQKYLTVNPYNIAYSISLFENDDLKEDEATKRAKREAKIEKWQSRPLSFDMLYEVVMELNKIFAPNGNGVYTYYEPSEFNPLGNFDHSAYRLLSKFAEVLVQEVVCPDWCGNMSYVSSARANVNRLYTLDSKDDFSQLLKNYFENRHLYMEYVNSIGFIGKRDYVVDSFMNRWIEKFEIGKAISLNIDQEGLGVQIRLHKTENDTGRILADEGYGITQLVSILLQIETAILAAQGEKVNNIWCLEAFDGYDTETFHYEINTIAIEEPEIHLHPKYQSLLADMFVEAYEKYNIHFIIETHSEYLIRKLQLIASEHGDEDEKGNKISVNRSDVSIFYVNAPSNKSKQKVKRIAICSDGYLDDTFGEGFYDEATKLSRRLM
ncbi:MAG: DUF3696 domain-containing protein [Muribaculaceae bacterium]|nr:DUF3696 domain-containing protein [Muribaculaceae bacterium]